MHSLSLCTPLSGQMQDEHSERRDMRIGEGKRRGNTEVQMDFYKVTKNREDGRKRERLKM